MPADARDRKAAAAVSQWFAAGARDLPWREEAAPGRRDPWASLVSEFMLQQTQVSRVLEKFGPFMERFPTPTALADAPEDDVLALWSGLGYYRRARMLHKAAMTIRDEFGGHVPETERELRLLPGVGRYTAAAVASIALGVRTPLVDGNVQRVLMRFDAHEGEQQARETVEWAWSRAGDLVRALPQTRRAGELNEGLMELGATVCAPKSPACGSCPLADSCAAHEKGLTDSIPKPRAAAKKSVVRATAVVVRNGAGKLLLEKRPDSGLWAGLWQAPTDEGAERPGAQAVAAARGVESEPAHAGAFVFETTHRSVEFEVWVAEGAGRARGGRRWVAEADLAGLGLSNAQRRVLKLASQAGERLF